MNVFKSDDDIVKVLLENKENNVLSLLYFTASWCGPCKAIGPFLEKLYTALKEKGDYNIEFYKVDIDENEEFCDKCKIKSVPTFIIMNGKDLLGSCNGASQEKISDLIVVTFNKYNASLKDIKNNQ